MIGIFDECSVIVAPSGFRHGRKLINSHHIVHCRGAFDSFGFLIRHGSAPDAILILGKDTDAFPFHGGEHLRAVGGDDELNKGECIRQRSKDQLLPLWVQMHVHFVDHDDAGGELRSVCAKVGVEADATVRDVTDEADDDPDTVAECGNGQAAMNGMFGDDGFICEIKRERTPANGLQKRIHRIDDGFQFVGRPVGGLLLAHSLLLCFAGVTLEPDLEDREVRTRRQALVVTTGGGVVRLDVFAASFGDLLRCPETTCAIVANRRQGGRTGACVFRISLR